MAGKTRLKSFKGNSKKYTLAMAVAAALGATISSLPARAASFYFSFAGGSTWDQATTADWSNTGPASPNYNQVWNSGSDANFQGTAGSVNVSGIISSVNSITFATDGYTLSGGTITLSGAGGNITTGTGTDTIKSTIAGTVGLTKLGTGSLTLSGANAYTGTTTVSAGTLKLDFSASGAPVTNIIATSSPLVLSGTSMLLMQGNSGANNAQTFAGTNLSNAGGARSITVNAGASGQAVLNLGAITIGGQNGAWIDFVLPTGTQSGSNGITATAQVTNGILTAGTGATGNAYATVNGGADWAALSTVASGNASNTAGNIVAYTGYTTATATNFNALANNMLVTASVTPSTATAIFSTVKFSGGTSGAPLILTLPNSTSNVIQDGGILVSSGSFATIAATGTGTLQMNAAVNQSSFNQFFIVDNGALTISAPLANGAAGLTTLVQAGNGTTTLTAANTYTGTTYIDSGTLQLGDGTTGHDGSLGGGAVTNNAALVYNVFGNQTASYAIGGSGALAKLGAGTLTFNNTSSSFTGNISVNQGVLQTGGSTNVLGNPNTAGRQVTVASGATLTFGNSDTFGTWLAAPAITLNINGTVNNNGANITALGAVNFNGGTLAATNGYSNNGVTAYALSSAYNVTVSGSTPSTISLTGARVALNGVVTFNVGDVTGDANADLIVAAPLSDHPNPIVGGVLKTGLGTMQISGANTYTGGTIVNGGTLQLGGSGTLGGTSGSLTVNTGGTLDLNGITQGVGNITGTGGSIINNAAGTVTLTIGNGNGSGNFAGSIATGTGAIALVKTGTGTETLSGTSANTNTGLTTVTSGALILSKTAGVAAISGNLAINGSSGNVWATANNQLSANTVVSSVNTSGSLVASFTLLSTTQTIAGLSSPTGGLMVANSTLSSGTPSPASNGAGTLVLGGAGSYVDAGWIWDNWDAGTGTTALTLNMAGGTQTLSGTDIKYTGATTVNTGTLALKDTTSFVSAVTVNGGGALSLVRNTASFASRTSIATTITGSGTINVNNTGSGVAGGWVSFQNGGGLVNFTGTVNVVTGGLTMDSLVGAWSGNPTLNVVSGGFFGIRGQNISIGALTGNGDIGNDWNGHAAAGDTLTFGANNGSGTFSGVIHGSQTAGTDGTFDNGIVNVIKAGTGTETLSGINTYTGTTTVNGGTLLLDMATNNSGVLSSSTALTLGGGTLNIKGKAGSFVSTQTLGNLTLSAGSSSNIIFNPNGGTSTNLTLGNTWTVGAGAYLLIDESAAGISTLTSSPTMTGNIINAGITVKDGTGTGLATVVSGKVVRLTSTTVLSATNSTAGTTTTDFTTTPTDAGYAGGSLVLTNAATHATDSLQIASGSGGTLDLGANPMTFTGGGLLMTGSGNYTIRNGQVGASNALLTVNQGGTGTLTIAGTVSSGSGALALTGGGALVLTGANAYSGGTTLGGGTLNVNADGALGGTSGAITFTNSSTLQAGANNISLLSTRGLTINAGAVATIDNQSNKMTIAGVIGGSGALTSIGGGTLVLSNANTYSGNTLVSAGTLTLSNNLALQNSAIDTSGAGVIALSSVTTPTIGGLAGGANLASVITTGYGSVTALTLNPGTGLSAIYTGAIADGAAGMTLTKTGLGIQTLGGSSANTYTGLTTVTAGALILAKTAGVAAIPGNLAINGSASAADVWATANNQLSANTVVSSVNSSGVAAFTLLGTTQTIAGLSSSGGGLMVDNTSTSTGSNANSRSPISGGAGTLVLAGSGSYVDAGWIWDNWDTGTGRVAISLNMGAGGTQTLSGGNFLYTGATTINTGRLKLLNTPSPYASAITVGASGTLELANTVTTPVSNIGLSSVSGSGAIIVTATGTTDPTTSGWFVIRGTAAATGTVTVQSGVYGAVSSTGSWAANTSSINLASTSSHFTTYGTANVQIGTLSGTGNVFNGQSGGTSTLTLGVDNGSGTFSGSIDGNNSTATNGGLNTGTINILKTGTGTQTLAGTNTYAGTTTVNNGTLAINGGALTGTSSLIAQAGGNVTITNGAVTAGTFGVGYQAAGASTVTLNSGTLNIGNTNAGTTGSLVFIGGTSNNAGAAGGTAGNGFLNISGGTVTVAAAGTFPNDALYLGGFGGSGTINLDGGTLSIARPVSNGGNSTFNFNGGTLKAGLSSTVFLNVATANVRNGGALIDTGGNNITIAQSLVHSTIIGDNATDGGLTKLGAGTLTLSNANTFNGVTLVSSGTLLLVNASAISNSTFDNSGVGTLSFGGLTSATFGGLQGTGNLALTNASAAAVALSVGANTTTFSGNLSGGGSLIKTGAGTLTLNASDSYTGTTSINGGALSVGNINALAGTSGISFGGGTLQYTAGNTHDYSNIFSTAASQTISIDTNGQAVTFGTALTSSGGTLTKLGNGTLTLTAANTYSGLTTVSAGTLTIASAGSLTSGGGITVNGATSVMNINGTYTNTSGTGAVTLTGGGVLNLSGTETIGGSNTSAIYVGNGSAGTINMTGGTLNVNYTNNDGLGIGWTAGGIGTLNVSGGTLTVASANTFQVGNGAGALGTLNFSGSAVVTTGYFDVGYGNNTGVGIANVSGNAILNIGNGGARIFIGGGASASGQYGTGTLTIGGNSQVNVAASGTFPNDNLYLAGYGGNGTITLNGGTLSTARGITNGAGNSAFNFNGGTLQATASVNILGFGNYGESNGGFITQAKVLGGGAIVDSNGFIANINQNLLDGGGGGGLTKIGSGTITLDGTNTYTGGTTVSAGTLRASSNLAASTSTINVASAATLDLGGSIQTSGAVTLSGGTITNGRLNGSSYAVTGGNISTALTGSGVLSKTTAGILTVSGASTYTGGTNLSGGTIIIGANGTAGTNPASGYKIVAAGDSITFGVGTTNATTQAWPVILGNQLGGNFTVYNEGHSGATALVDGSLPYAGTAEYTAGLALNPNAVVIQLGTNDSTTANFAKGQTDFVNSLTAIVNAYKATTNHPSIWLALPPGIYTAAPNQNEANLAVLMTYIQQVATATGATIIDNNTMLLNEATLYADGLHPNTQGAALLGQNVYSSLASTYFNNGPLGTGTVTLSSGTLSDDGNTRTLTNPLAITGSVTFASTGSGGLIFDPTGLATASTTTISNTPTLTVNNNVTIKEVIGGTGFSKAGNGTLTLSASNNYTGGTTLTAGRILATTNTALGAGTVTLNGGTLALNGGLTVANNMAAPVGTNSSIILAASGGSAAMTLSGSLTGTGTVNISSANTGVTNFIPILSTLLAPFAGTVSIDTSTVQFYTDLGTLDGSAIKFIINGPNAGTSGNAAFVFSQQTNATVKLGELSGNGVIGSGNATGNVTTWQVGALNTNSTFSGIIRDNVLFGTGKAALTKVGTGTLTLSGTNTYTGGTTVSNGTLAVNGGSITGSGTMTIQSGGTMSITNGSVSIASGGAFGTGYGATGTGTTTVGSGGTLTIGTGGGLTFVGGGPSGGPNFGTGILNINTGGIVNVAAAGAFPNERLYLNGFGGTNGTINITGGTLNTSRGIGLGSVPGFVNFDGGTVRVGVSGLTLLESNVTTTIKDGGVIIDTNGFTTTVAAGLAHGGVAATDGGLTKNGAGTLTLSGAGNYTGGTTLNAGGVVIGNNTALGTSSLTLNAGTLGIGSGLTVANNMVAPSGTTSSIVLAGNTAQNLSGTLTGSGTVNFSTTATAQIVPTMPSTTTFTGTIGVDTSAAGNIFFPAFNGSAGAKWVVTGGGTGSGAASGSFLFTTSTAVNLGELSGNGRVGAANANTIWSIGALNTNSTFSGVIIDNYFGGAAAINKVGTGTLTLSGVNAYSGNTTVSAGKLVLSGANTMTGATIPAGGTLVVGNQLALQNSTLAMNSGDTGAVSFSVPAVTLGGLRGTRNLNLGSTAVSIGNNNLDSTYSGNLSGSNGLTKIGTGVTTIAGTNTYTGTTIISAGTLRLAAPLPSNLQVMPLGDSITEGQGANSGTQAGYREPLYNLLSPLAPGMQYIGSATVIPGALPANEQNHEGHGGNRIDQIYNNLDGLDNSVGNADGGYWFTGGNGTGRSAVTPNLILLHIGTNDILQNYQLSTIQSRLDSLVNKIVTEEPNAKLIVSDIVPITTSADATVISYNTMVNAVVAKYAALGDHVTLVDLHTGFPSGGMSSDNVHPDAIGYDWMASQWENAILADYAGTITSAALPSASPVSISSGATLDLNGNVAAIGPLLGGGNVTLGTGGALTINSINTNNTSFSGAISGTGGMTLAGNGIQTLSGTNTYTGVTTITAGTLALTDAGKLASSKIIVGDTAAHGSATFDVSNVSGGFHVVSGQTLAGHGVVLGGVTINSGAHLAPGNSVGTITISTLTLSSGSILDYEFNNTANDFTNVTTAGGLNISGGGFNLYQEGTTNPFSTAGTYHLIGYNTSFSGSISNLSVLNPVGADGYTFTNNTALHDIDLTISGAPHFSVPTPINVNLLLNGNIAAIVTNDGGTTGSYSSSNASGLSIVSGGSGSVAPSSTGRILVALNGNNVSGGNISGSFTVTGVSNSQNVNINALVGTAKANNTDYDYTHSAAAIPTPSQLSHNLNANGDPLFLTANALTADVSSGGAYDGLSSTVTSTTNGGSYVGTTATFLKGNADSNKTVTMNWRNRSASETRPTQTVGPMAHPNEFLISDVVLVTGMGLNGNNTGYQVQTDIFALSMTYNPSDLPGNETTVANSQGLYLGWLSPTTNTWLNAVAGDFGGMSASDGFQGAEAFSAYFANHGTLSNDLGAWGVDTTNHTVWAVLDHNSEFGVVVPEPTSLGLLGLGALGLLGRKRRKSRA